MDLQYHVEWRSGRIVSKGWLLKGSFSIKSIAFLKVEENYLENKNGGGKINNPSITALYHFCPNFIDFNGTKTTTIQTWRALVQTSKLGLIDLNPSSNAARKIIYFVYKAVLMILQLLPVVSRWQMLVVRVKRFIYQNIRTISISESQKPTNILQKSAHSSQCTLFVKRLNESLGGCCCLMSLTLGDFLGRWCKWCFYCVQRARKRLISVWILKP